MQNRSYYPQLYKSGPHRSLEEQPPEILGKAMQFTWVFCKRKTTLSLFSWKPLTELGHTSIPFFLPEPHKTESRDQNKVSRITVFSSSAYTCLHRRLQVWLVFPGLPPINHSAFCLQVLSWGEQASHTDKQFLKHDRFLLLVHERTSRIFL